MHEADEASLRLLHYLARCAVTEPVLVALAHRRSPTAGRREVVDSLVARGSVAGSSCSPSTRPPPAGCSRSAARPRRELADTIVRRPRGLPFRHRGRPRSVDGGSADLLPALPEDVMATFRRVALLGSTFTTDELLALAEGDEEAAYLQLHAAGSGAAGRARGGRAPVPARPGPRGLVAQLPPAARLSRAADRRRAARRPGGAAEPGRPPVHRRGPPVQAVPYVRSAVETAGALGAYRDGLALVDAVRHTPASEALPRLLARRGDLLMAPGDPGRSRPTRGASAHHRHRAPAGPGPAGPRGHGAGDLDTARAALAGLELEGDVADGPMLLARGNLAYFTGDIDAAWAVARQARDMLTLATTPGRWSTWSGCRA